MPRGSKTCPSCNQTCGPRSYVYPNCSTPFSVAKIQTETPQTVVSQKVERDILITVYTPAGKCPISLNNTDPEEIERWKDEVRDFGVQHGKRYTDDALDYWLATMGLAPVLA